MGCSGAVTAINVRFFRFLPRSYHLLLIVFTTPFDRSGAPSCDAGHAGSARSMSGVLSGARVGVADRGCGSRAASEPPRTGGAANRRLPAGERWVRMESVRFRRLLACLSWRCPASYQSRPDGCPRATCRPDRRGWRYPREFSPRAAAAHPPRTASPFPTADAGPAGTWPARAGIRSRFTTRPPKARRSTWSTRPTAPSTPRSRRSARAPPARCALDVGSGSYAFRCLFEDFDPITGPTVMVGGHVAAPRHPAHHQRRPPRPGPRVPRLVATGLTRWSARPPPLAADVRGREPRCGQDRVADRAPYLRAARRGLRRLRRLRRGDQRHAAG